MLRALGRWFWIFGLGLAVLVFGGLAIFALIFAFRDHDWKLLIPALGMGVFGEKSFTLFKVRFNALPGDPLPPLEEWEPPDFG
jgi:hypothetical protein